MKKVEDLKIGDYIAFKFTYNGTYDEIIVSKITSIHGKRFYCHFLYGHHSLSEDVIEENILAIGNLDGESGLSGWTGKYDLIQPEHELVKTNLK